MPWFVREGWCVCVFLGEVTVIMVWACIDVVFVESQEGFLVEVSEEVKGVLGGLVVQQELFESRLFLIVIDHVLPLVVLR